jgi:hypothetical protein
MAAPLGFKTFATGDVLTAADTNGYLMQGVWVFADAAARDAAVTSPQEGNMCYLKDTNAVQFYSGSAWTAVGAASKVVQVVSGTTTTAVASSSSTFADTGITATITPTSASNLIMVFVVVATVFKQTNDTSANFRLVRGATTIARADTLLYTGGATPAIMASVPMNYVDSPATTSATTYKVTFNSNSNNAQVTVQFGGTTTSSIILMEVTP